MQLQHTETLFSILFDPRRSTDAHSPTCPRHVLRSVLCNQLPSPFCVSPGAVIGGSVGRRRRRLILYLLPSRGQCFLKRLGVCVQAIVAVGLQRHFSRSKYTDGSTGLQNKRPPESCSTQSTLTSQSFRSSRLLLTHPSGLRSKLRHI